MLKLRLDTAVIQQGRLSDRQSQLNKTDLMRMIQFGADQIYKSSTNDVTQLTDEDIELILSRGEEKVQELSGKLENHLQQKSLLDFDFSSPANLYEFEGIDYNADRQAWAQIGKLRGMMNYLLTDVTSKSRALLRLLKISNGLNFPL